MLSNELETCLNAAFQTAREGRHEFLTVEHLLLSIIDTPKVQEVLRACGADPDSLSSELREHIDSSTPRVPQSEEREVQPTLGFQRVLQRAVFHVQSSGRKEVGVVNVLVAIFSEKQSHAVFLLAKQDVSRLDVVNYISHGMSKVEDASVESREESATQKSREAESESALDKYATNLNQLAEQGKSDGARADDRDLVP